MTTAAASATPSTAAARAVADRDLPAEPRRDGAVVRPDRARAAPARRDGRRPALHAAPRAAGRGRSRRQAGGRYLDCPIEDDPAHALNRAWSTLAADPLRARVTHVVAFGGSRPIVAAPVFAAWLGVPLITLIRGNDFDAAVFSTRRRPVLDDALERSALVCAVSQDKVDEDRRAAPGRARALDPERDRPRPTGSSRRATSRGARVPRARLGERRVLGLFGQLKAKKGGVFLLDALLRSGVADALPRCCSPAGWSPSWRRGWPSTSCASRRSRSWIATSCCRGTRRATGSRSRRSTTGCRTCSSRRRRSACRWSPRAPAGWPTCSTTARRRSCSSPATRRAAPGRCSARRGWTSPSGSRWAQACRDARARPSSTASSRSRATSRRWRRPALRAGGGRVILYYALGGGLGHLARARKVLDALGIEGDAAHRVALRRATRA